MKHLIATLSLVAVSACGAAPTNSATRDAASDAAPTAVDQPELSQAPHVIWTCAMQGDRIEFGYSLTIIESSNGLFPAHTVSDTAKLTTHELGRPLRSVTIALKRGAFGNFIAKGAGSDFSLKSAAPVSPTAKSFDATLVAKAVGGEAVNKEMVCTAPASWTPVTAQ